MTDGRKVLTTVHPPQNRSAKQEGQDDLDDIAEYAFLFHWCKGTNKFSNARTETYFFRDILLDDGNVLFLLCLGRIFLCKYTKKSDMNTVFTRKNDISSKKVAYFDGFDRFFVPLGP